MQKILVPIIVFCVVLIALTFGEGVFRGFATLVYEWTGIVLYNLNDFFLSIWSYVQAHPVKIVLALLITAGISVWLHKNHGEELNKPANTRKIAIVLAIFLGWTGAHRFYLNQMFAGIVFILISLIFIPLSVFLSGIDAIRYMYTDDETFVQRYTT